MKYYRFLPVVVLSLCTTFLTHSAFSQTEITTLSSSSVSESETDGSFVITSTIDAASSDDVFIPLSFSGDAEFNQDYLLILIQKVTKQLYIVLGIVITEK